MNRVIVSKFGGGLRADEGALAEAERVKQALNQTLHVVMLL